MTIPKSVKVDFLKWKQYPAAFCKGQRRENSHRRDLGLFYRDNEVLERKQGFVAFRPLGEWSAFVVFSL